MSFRFFILVLLLPFGLVACSTPSGGKLGREYLTQSEPTQPILVPAGAVPPKQKPYYQVPATHVKASDAALSLIPPGSKILQYRESMKKKTRSGQANTAVRVTARWNAKHDALLLPLKPKIAWQRVGKALQHARLRVLDTDNAMRSYYVMSASTITQSTPIYRIAIQAFNDQSQIRVFNQKNQLANTTATKHLLSALRKQLV